MLGVCCDRRSRNILRHIGRGERINSAEKSDSPVEKCARLSLRRAFKTLTEEVSNGTRKLLVRDLSLSVFHLCYLNFVTTDTATFISEVKRSLADKTFVKLTLSNYKGSEARLQKVAVRPIETKKGARLLFQFRYETRDVVKNYDPDESVRAIGSLLASGFRNGHLFTTAKDFQLTIGKKSSKLFAGKPTFKTRLDTSHDHSKKTLIAPNAFYLRALGIATDSGEIRAQQQDKWRQINNYLEILSALVDKSPLKDKPDLQIVDMGSGKGYLTFSAYDYFANVRGLNVKMTGVDTKSEIVDLCNDLAESGEFTGLKFIEGSIADFDIGNADILMALHACDTATDDALFKGITAQAAIIVAAPCCHKEIRRQITPPELLRDILKHGSMLEREAETVTDGLRTMLLEWSGYSTKIIEFVATEHTPKNNMIAATRNPAVRTAETERLRGQIAAVKEFYGITEQRLENLLA